MEYLWSPWRMKYIQNGENPGDECIFCKFIKETTDRENFIIHRGEYVFVILNRFPYTSGHLMVVPNDHQSSFEGLSVPVLTEILTTANKCFQVLRSIYHPQAFNMGANIGLEAGAGIADHVHMHIVPRWTGDTNFMSVVNQTRVLPEELEETYRRISSKWNEC